ncbi:MAG: hypothetical protein GY783_01740, partial [Gammaproteobacteria bacterium]|nr:hypothetical protein [Gammaproteobacteria bacterium]
MYVRVQNLEGSIVCNRGVAEIPGQNIPRVEYGGDEQQDCIHWAAQNREYDQEQERCDQVLQSEV